MYIKALSLVENYPHERKRWTTESIQHTSVKIFAKSYDEVQERIFHEFSSEYYTPLPMPAFEEGYNWGDGVIFYWISYEKPTGDWENVLLSECSVFIMNNEGKTIDTMRAGTYN